MASSGCRQATARGFRHRMHYGDADAWSSGRNPPFAFLIAVVAFRVVRG